MKNQDRKDKRFRITYYDNHGEKLYYVFVWCASLKHAKELLDYGMQYRRSKHDSYVSYGKVRYDNILK